MAEAQQREFASFELIEREGEDGETEILFAETFDGFRPGDKLYPTEPMLRDAIAEATGRRPDESIDRCELVSELEGVIERMKESGEYRAILDEISPNGR